MVAPTGTLPKSTAAGLELSTADEEVVEVSAAEATEVPLALVMPVQPIRKHNDKEKMANAAKSGVQPTGQTPRRFKVCLFCHSRCNFMNLRVARVELAHYRWAVQLLYRYNCMDRRAAGCGGSCTGQYNVNYAVFGLRRCC